MRGVLFDQPGEPLDVLRFAEGAEPTPRDDVVIVKVVARPIHPADLAFVRGRYRIQPTLPQFAGLEGTGIVVDAPAGSGFAAGERVAFRTPGTWAEHLAVQLDRLTRVPTGMSDEDASQISLNPLTALGLIDMAEAQAGEWVLITAGTSTVANLVAALSKARGLRTIAIVRGSPAAARGRTGADMVLSTDEPDIAARIRDTVAGSAVGAILDSVGGPALVPLMTTLRPGGRVVAYGVLDPSPAPVPNALLIYSNLSWVGFGIDRWLSSQSAEAKAAATASLGAMLKRGELHLPVSERFPLAAFADAIRADAEPGRTGKILLV